MKFALALLAFTTVQAIETEAATELEWGGYGHAGRHAVKSLRTYVAPRATYHYNGHGHHEYSYTSNSSDSSYSSHDYSSSDHGYGYRTHHGRNRYYRYKPRYHSGRYYYGKRYASHTGHYKAAYRSYGLRSYSACVGGCLRPNYYGKW